MRDIFHVLNSIIDYIHKILSHNKILGNIKNNFHDIPHSLVKVERTRNHVSWKVLITNCHKQSRFRCAHECCSLIHNEFANLRSLYLFLIYCTSKSRGCSHDNHSNAKVIKQQEWLTFSLTPTFGPCPTKTAERVH